MDIYAFRVVVDTPDTCYRVLVRPIACTSPAQAA
ncbi:hypothetical protein OK016_10085 [Vibrio chagasii]|nr:hypothetical protein [Vibrio chagasii]